MREKPRGYLTGKLYKGNVSAAIQALSGTQHALKKHPALVKTSRHQPTHEALAAWRFSRQTEKIPPSPATGA